MIELRIRTLMEDNMTKAYSSRAISRKIRKNWISVSRIVARMASKKKVEKIMRPIQTVRGNRVIPFYSHKKAKVRLYIR